MPLGCPSAHLSVRYLITILIRALKLNELIEAEE